MTADTAAFAPTGELEPLEPEEFQRIATEIEAAVGRTVVGQREAVRGALICLIAGGHALLEGVPGLGKTTLARSLAAALDLEPKRIQFTPDLMPADITGNVAEIEAAINKIPANGGTNVYKGLARGVREIERSKAKDRHIILPTDGISEPGSYRQLVRGLKKARSASPRWRSGRKRTSSC
jgi:ATPase family associated with various cellular activities (AAA)